MATKIEQDIAWEVAHGNMTKAEAARKLKVSTQGINTRLFNGLVEALKETESN